MELIRKALFGGAKKWREKRKFGKNLPENQASENVQVVGTTEPEEPDYTVEVKKDYDVDLLDESQISSLKRRARSATPRRTLNIEPAGPGGPIPVCAFCQEEIDGPVLTALAPNATRAQKFHPFHFMCCYCQKALNLHGTFREHERRPYCHECFYKLWNGLIYEPDSNQRKIEKLI